MKKKTKDISLSEKRNLRELERRSSNREAIFQAAEAVICRKGFSAASMDDVAAEAGFSKATLYKYIKNKSELVIELLVHFIETLDGRLQEVIARPDKHEPKLKALIREVLRIQAEKEPLAKAFLTDQYMIRLVHAMVQDAPGNEAEKEFLRRIMAAQKRVYARLEAFLEDGISAGTFRPMAVDSAVRFLGVLAQGYKHDNIFRETKPDLEKDVSDIYTFVLHGLSSGIKA